MSRLFLEYYVYIHVLLSISQYFFSVMYIFHLPLYPLPHPLVHVGEVTLPPQH